MMTAQDVIALAGREGTTLSAEGGHIRFKTSNGGPISGKLLNDIKANKAELMALLERPPGPGPCPSTAIWREPLGMWPIVWRERWGRRSNELEGTGLTWGQSEWIAFHEISRELKAAEDLGLVPGSEYANPFAPPLLSDREAVRGIDLAFSAGDEPGPDPPRGWPKGADYETWKRWRNPRNPWGITAF